jgi:hypothetical protein
VGQFIPGLFTSAASAFDSPEKWKNVPGISGFWIVSEAFAGSPSAKCLETMGKGVNGSLVLQLLSVFAFEVLAPRRQRSNTPRT